MSFYVFQADMGSLGSRAKILHKEDSLCSKEAAARPNYIDNSREQSIPAKPPNISLTSFQPFLCWLLEMKDLQGVELPQGHV